MAFRWKVGTRRLGYGSGFRCTNDDDRAYLAWGGGVNSTALLCLLLDQGIDVHVFWVDTGAEHPETIAYRDRLIALGVEIETLRAKRGGMDLYERCYAHRVIPSVHRRWCTVEYKLRPSNRFVRKPCFVYVGIGAEESGRVARTVGRRGAPGVHRQYPLIEMGIDREACEEIIRTHGLPAAGKSACWLCPFQGARSLLRLSREYPEYWDRLCELEERTVSRQRENGGGVCWPYYGRPVRELVEDEARGLVGHRGMETDAERAARLLERDRRLRVRRAGRARRRNEVAVYGRGFGTGETVGPESPYDRVGGWVGP